MKHNKRGFLLFEVVVTIAILSIGLVFVVRSVQSSMNVAQASFYYSKALNYMHEKLFEWEFASMLAGWNATMILEDTGIFNDDDDYQWECMTEPNEVFGLDQLTVEVSWQKTKRSGSLDTTTFLAVE